MVEELSIPLGCDRLEGWEVEVLGTTGCCAAGGVLDIEDPDTRVDTVELDLGGWTFCVTGQETESTTVFVGLLIVASVPIWFRMRLSWGGGRPGADHDRELYPERPCCCCCGGGSGDGWLTAGF